MTVRIGLSGKMRSGKDTVASRLVDAHGFAAMAFADRLKDLASNLFGVREGDKNRAILQALGWRMAQVDRAVWSKYVLDRVPMDRDVVVTDVRFPIEYHALRGLGFFMVRLEIGREEQLKRLATGDPGMDPALLDDPSETALDGLDSGQWGLVLNGEMDKAVLWAHMDGLVRELRAR